MAPSLEVMRTELSVAMAGGASALSAADALCATCVGLVDVDGAAVSIVTDSASSGTFGSSSETSRRLDEYQFTFGQGPCLDAVASRTPVMVPDLDSPQERRWPVLTEALLGDGIRGVFALPIMITSVCVGALDLFRARPGPLEGDSLAGAMLAAELASTPLLSLIAESRHADDLDELSWPDAEQHAEGPRTDGDEPSRAVERVEVYQATGMLISALDVDADEALARLRAHAMSTGQTASQVARAIIERRLLLDRDDDRQDGSGRDPR